MTYIRKEDGTCKCGRSPTGDCIGWHKLTEEQYQEKTEEDKEKIINEVEKLLNNKDEYDKMSKANNPYGDGKASQKICDFLRKVIRC